MIRVYEAKILTALVLRELLQQNIFPIFLPF